MRTTFADTAFFIALFNKDDEHHARATARLTQTKSKIITSIWILVEFGNFIAATPSRRRFASFVRDLVATDRIRIVPALQRDFDAAVRLFDERPDKDWSLVDCTSFGIMNRMRIQDALTSDHHFRQAGFQVLL